MKCKCEKEMKFISCWDEQNVGYAFNLYLCIDCGQILKEDVWDNKGKMWIDIDNEVEKENREISKNKCIEYLDRAWDELEDLAIQDYPELNYFSMDFEELMNNIKKVFENKDK